MNNVIIASLTDFLRSGSQCSPSAKAEFQENSQRALYSSGIDFAPCNGIIEKEEKSHLKEAEIDDIISLFSSKKLPFVWWTNNKSLEARGFQFGGIMKGLALDAMKNNLKTAPSLPGLKIKSIETEEDVKIFANLIGNCFGFSSEVIQQYSDTSHSAMERKQQKHFMAYINDIPVSTVTLTITGTTAGIWNGATLPEYRRQGIGTALCFTAIAEAKACGCEQVVAVLMPKGLAWGLCRDLGFKEISSLPFYVFGAAADELEA